VAEIASKGEQMAGRMEGKVALISGSTRGIGRSMAERFAAEGAKVAVTGRNVEKGTKVVEQITQAGGEARFFPLDIFEEHTVKSSIEAVVEHFGSLTTLVNNAAPTSEVATTVKELNQLTTEEWTTILTGTLTGNVFWASKYAWPHLAAAEGASITNISSGQSLVGITGFAAYSAAKGGVNSVTRVLAVEGAPYGIRCNNIAVGRVVAGRGDSAVGIGEKTGGRLTRLGNPMDIAYAAVWLASDEGAFVTGEMIVVDGGFAINGDALIAS
jgi:NAD(P)-dependent dehydrogenase (short-subunit alcohol dehydrogenase family)